MTISLPGDLERVAVRLYDGIGTPVALACKKALQDGKWDDLASMRVEPGKYSDSDSYWLDACAVSFLRKVEELPTSVDRAQVAVDNFWKCERECWRTNERLQPYLRDPREWAGDPVVRELIDRARKIVVGIIGHAPPQNIVGRFGPGATYADKGQYTTVPDKMSSDPTLTRGALWSLIDWVGTAWATACATSRKSPQFIRGNRFTTVPKDCTKDRGIAVEPSINSFYQLGYGRAIRACLKRAGLDLVKGQTIHRQVALWASIEKLFATLDLSNASDTVCRALVELLLPKRWFEALDALRSKSTLINNKWVYLEKFSSMGNGFTFELETLLFAAISKATLEMSGQPASYGRDVFVYGDDIIVPTGGAKDVISALRLLGFTPNVQKTFVDGPFRESCGGDYFEGVDVRPYFLDKYPNEPQDFIALANGIRRAATKGRPDDDMDPRFVRAWLAALDAVPSKIRRCRGPSQLGDLVITDRRDTWQTRSRSWIRYLQVWRPARYRKVSWAHFRPNVVLASAVYGVGDGTPGGVTEESLRLRRRDSEGSREFRDSGGIIPRDAVAGYKIGWVPFS